MHHGIRSGTRTPRTLSSHSASSRKQLPTSSRSNNSTPSTPPPPYEDTLERVGPPLQTTPQYSRGGNLLRRHPRAIVINLVGAATAAVTVAIFASVGAIGGAAVAFNGIGVVVLCGIIFASLGYLLGASLATCVLPRSFRFANFPPLQP